MKNDTSTKSSSEEEELDNFRKVKKMKTRKVLDTQHKRISIADEISKEIPAQKEEEKKTAKDEDLFAKKEKNLMEKDTDEVLRKRDFSGKYDLVTCPKETERKFSNDDLNVYMEYDSEKKMTLINQNGLLKQIFEIPQEAALSSIVQKIKRADQLFEEEQRTRTIYSTGIEELDDLFDLKGIRSGEIVEFCGQCGIGKSTLVLTLLVNILSLYKNETVLYFDTKNDFHSQLLVDILKIRGFNDEEMKDITERIIVVPIGDILELIQGLDSRINQEPSTENTDNEQAQTLTSKILVIDSITLPFFQCTEKYERNQKIMSHLLMALTRISRMGIVTIITNLGLHKYRLSESDAVSEKFSEGSQATDADDEENTTEDEDEEQRDDDDICSLESSHTVNLNLQCEDLTPALDSFWADILDYRFLVTAPKVPKIDILGFVEVHRIITMIEPPTMDSVKLKITDAGVVSDKTV